MKKYKGIFWRFARDESGLSAVEYGLLAAGIAVAIYSIIADVGNSLHTIFSSVNTDLQPGS
jgi:pilus assembly protein Flp/PilA